MQCFVYSLVLSNSIIFSGRKLLEIAQRYSTRSIKLSKLQCKGSLYEGNLVINAERFGRDVYWHPQCFVCTECSNLLVDLIYFKHGADVYCGRHHAEQIKPRCAKCDEVSSFS